MISKFVTFLGYYVFYYPVIMSFAWMIGATFFFFRREFRKSKTPPELTAHPLVSVLIPAHNEAQDIADSVRSVYSGRYKNIEVIVINDASTDSTGEILESLLPEYPSLKLLNLDKNMGKANGLNLALGVSKGEIIFTLDADSMLDEYAIEWAVWHFINFPRVGAVTGNPRVRNRSTLLSRIQTAEYSSVIGLIKRTQRIMGRIMTVSGVVAAWRRSALIDSGLWNNTVITDDIEMTWKVERRFWDVRYEPNMLCWMLVPETLRGIWMQRKRWARGGMEVIRKNVSIWKGWKEHSLWLLYIDYLLGVFWALAFLVCVALWLFSVATGIGLESIGNPFIGVNGAVVASVCLLQFTVSLIIDSRYEKGLWRILIWVVWYPVIYWAFNAVITIAAIPAGFFRPLNRTATWASPDRGVRQSNGNS